MNILVTGGAGFIGYHVCERLLREGHRVTICDNMDPFYNPRLKWINLKDLKDAAHSVCYHQVDVANQAALEGIFKHADFDQVIHLAAVPGVQHSINDPRPSLRANIESFTCVLEAARKFKVNKVILASSSTVYGAQSQLPFTEHFTGHAISPYAVSKLACEQLGHVYHHVHGLDVTVLRLFSVYGPRMRPDLAMLKFIRALHARQPIAVNKEDSARDYTYVDDIVDGIVACTKRRIGYDIYNLGTGRTVTVVRLIEMLERATGLKAVTLTRTTPLGDVPVTMADIREATRRLAYVPSTPLELGIKRTVTWAESTIT